MFQNVVGLNVYMERLNAMKIVVFIFRVRRSRRIRFKFMQKIYPMPNLHRGISTQTRS